MKESTSYEDRFMTREELEEVAADSEAVVEEMKEYDDQSADKDGGNEEGNELIKLVERNYKGKLHRLKEEMEAKAVEYAEERDGLIEEIKKIGRRNESKKEQKPDGGEREVVRLPGGDIRVDHLVTGTRVTPPDLVLPKVQDYIELCYGYMHRIYLTYIMLRLYAQNIFYVVVNKERGRKEV